MRGYSRRSVASPTTPTRGLIEQWAPVSALARASTKSGPDRRADAFYAEWAAGYVKAFAIRPRAPNKLLHEEAKMRGDFIEEETIRGHIQEARRRVLFTSLGKGKPGGRLTKKGPQALADAGIDPDNPFASRIRG